MYKKNKNCLNCGKLINERSIRCNSCAKKEKLNPMYGSIISKENRQKMLQSLIIQPNKPEKAIMGLMKDNGLLYEYTGNGKLIIGDFNPDFVNFQNKKIIEVFGDYWHNRIGMKEKDKRRLKIYTKKGYKTLIIREHEIKNLIKTKNKILKFENYHNDTIGLVERKVSPTQNLKLGKK